MNGAMLQKILRGTGLVSGGLLLFCLLAAGVFMLWLGSAHAARTIYGLTAKHLAASGIYLNVDEVTGHLPFKVSLTNLRVADKDGTWFEAREINIALDPFRIFYGTLVIESAQASEPRLLRLPSGQSGNSAVLPAWRENEESAFETLTLPVGVMLKQLQITHASMAPGALALPNAEQEDLAQERRKHPALPEELSASLELSGFIGRGALKEASLRLDAKVELDLRVSVDKGEKMAEYLPVCSALVRGFELGLPDRAFAVEQAELEVHDETLYEALGLSTEETGGRIALWGETAARLRGTAGQNGEKFEFDLSIDLDAESSHPYFTQSGLHAALELKGALRGMQIVFDRLAAKGMGISFDGKGGCDLRNLASSLEGDIGIQRNGGWHQVVSALGDTDSIPAGNIHGRLRANLEPEKPDAAHIDFRALRLFAAIQAGAEGMIWPAEILYKALGTYAYLDVDFSGPVLSPYHANIHKARAGVTAQDGKNAPYRASVSGWYELALAGVIPSNPSLAHSLAEQTEHLAMYGEANVILPDFGVFTPGSGLGGPVEGRAAMLSVIKDRGSFFDFTAQGNNAVGAFLSTPFEKISAFAVSGDVHFEFENGLDMRGAIKADSTLPKSGRVTLNGGWFLRKESDKPLNVGMNDLHVSAVGADLSGHMRISLWPEVPVIAGKDPVEAFAGAAALPAFDGELLLRAHDRRSVNELFERLDVPVDVTGAGELSLKLGFEAKARQNGTGFTQNAAGMLDLAEISLLWGEKTAQTRDTRRHEAIIKNIQGRAEAEDIFSVPVMSAYFKTGSGTAGLANWKSFAADLDLAGKSGRVNLAARDDKMAANYVDSVDEATPDFAGIYGAAEKGRIRIRLPDAKKEHLLAENRILPEELMVLQADFNLDPLELMLRRVVLHSPPQEAGLFLREPAYIYLGEEKTIKQLSLGMLTGGQVDCEAFFQRDRAGLSLALRDVPLGTARIFTDAPLPDGNINALLAVDAQNGQVNGKGNLKMVLEPMRSRFDELYDSTPIVLDVKTVLSQEPGAYFPAMAREGVKAGVIRLHGEAVAAPAGESGAKMANLEMRFDVPLTFSSMGVPSLHYDAPLGARASWKGDVKNIWRLLPIPDRDLGGIGKFGVEVGGSFAGLTYSGNAYLADGRYEDKVAGFIVSDINAELKSTVDGALLLLSATDGLEGKAALEARLTGAPLLPTGLGSDSAPLRARRPFAPMLAARGQVNHFAPLRRDDVYMRASGIMDAKGPLTSPDITANLVVERGDVNVLSSLGGDVSRLPVEDRAQAGAKSSIQGGGQLSVKVDIPNRLFIRGLGLDSEWQGQALVRGPLAAPSFEGSVRPVRGYLNLLSRPFELGQGEINFWGGDGLDSSIALQLTYSSTNLIAYLDASGSADKPRFTLSSVPPMPQDQILSEVLFGKNFTQLSAFEALQVANGLRELVGFGSGGFDLFTGMRRVLGVDTLRIGSTATTMQNRSISGSPGVDVFGGGVDTGATDETASPTVEAGKYINDSIYIGVEQGAIEDSTRVRVEVELKPNLTLQGSSSTKSSDVGIGWKHDY